VTGLAGSIGPAHCVPRLPASVPATGQWSAAVGLGLSSELVVYILVAVNIINYNSNISILLYRVRLGLET
jgi:hypothetical protein